MRVGINATVLGGHDTGVEIWTRGLIRALAHARSCNEYVVYLREGIDPMEGELVPPNMRWHEVEGLPQSRVARIVWEEFQLPRLTRQDRLDLLHCPAYVAPHRVPVPTVVTLHDLFVYTHPRCCRFRNRLHFRLRLPSSVRHAGCVHCTSHWTQRCLAAEFPEVVCRSSVVHPAVDDLFGPRSAERLEQYRQTHGLPHKPYLFVGNPEPKKNLKLLLRAFAHLKAQWGERRKLVLVGGDGWPSMKLDRLIDELNIGDHVIRTGYVPRHELPYLYGLSSALVFPSVIEGFGLPPLEAMACGTPVITSGTGGLRESVGPAGLVVDALSPGHVARAMNHVVERTSMRNDLIQAGLKRVRQFRWDRLVGDMLRLYRESI